MRFRPPEEEIILYQTGFSSANSDAENADILQRTQFGKTLSNLVENTDDSLVIALNSGWGTGKTWFLKRWVGAHASENSGKALTLYISAFNHDYLEDPFAAIILALEARLQKEASTIKKLFAKLALPVAKIGMRVAAAYASAGMSEALGAGIKAAEENTEQAADMYWRQQQNKQHAVEQFRNTLTEIAKDQKLIIVIDELDRARPDYALAMLETIKHFFEVDGVHFVLGINMEALEGMVKCRYGQECDARTYLQRFISLSLTLPDSIQRDDTNQKVVVTYAQWAAEKMGIDKILQQILLSHLNCVIKNNPMSLRDAERILSHFSLMLNAVGTENFLNLSMAKVAIYLTLLVSKIVSPAYYAKFLSATITEEEILKYYGIDDESEYRNLENRFHNYIRSHNKTDGDAIRLAFIKYLDPIKEYYELLRTNSSDRLDYSLTNTFMWNALRNFTRLTFISPRTASIHDFLTDIESQYLNIGNLNIEGNKETQS